MLSFPLFRINHGHLKFLTNHTIVVGHHMSSAQMIENSQTRAARKDDIILFSQPWEREQISLF